MKSIKISSITRAARMTTIPAAAGQLSAGTTNRLKVLSITVIRSRAERKDSKHLLQAQWVNHREAVS